MQQGLHQTVELLTRDRLTAANKSVRKLFEESTLLLERRPHRVGELLRPEAKFKERLVVLPTVNADENCNEQPKAQQHWDGDGPDPRPPQVSRLCGKNE